MLQLTPKRLQFKSNSFALLLLKQRTTKHLKSEEAERHLEQGMTLLETLAAIFIITTVVALSTPPILLSTATRVQNRRAEQAMQLAQQEIERVRLIVDQGNYTNSDLPPADSSITNPVNIKDVDAPTSVCTTSCTATQAQEKDNFLVQVFREPGVTQAGVGPGGSNQVVSFRMGVRVYSSAAREELNSGGNLNTTIASLQFTSGQGSQRQSPLAILYTDFTRGDLSGSLERYRQHLD